MKEISKKEIKLIFIEYPVQRTFQSSMFSYGQYSVNREKDTCSFSN